MNVLDRAADGIGAALAMAFDREGWRSKLDDSVDGVFGSFRSVLFAAPLIILYSATAKRAADRIPALSNTVYGQLPATALIAADLATFLADWAASLFLLVMLARSLGATRRAAGLIVGFNWLQPVIVAVQLPAIALVAATSSTATGGMIALPALAFTLTLTWGLVRRGLDAKPAPAIAVVAMLLVIGVVIRALGDGALRALFGVQP